ncbi:hypothetical protein GCM10009539_05830 [Cryptosporangium japonicum]|uniref:Uncharacterized protein n=1 Tax=Cryptosporangium japonicum TaxID=80872 RepID=A0ABN0TJT5_9ACTN
MRLSNPRFDGVGLAVVPKNTPLDSTDDTAAAIRAPRTVVVYGLRRVLAVRIMRSLLAVRPVPGRASLPHPAAAERLTEVARSARC